MEKKVSGKLLGNRAQKTVLELQKGIRGAYSVPGVGGS